VEADKSLMLRGRTLLAPNRNSLRRSKSSGSLGIADTEAEPSGLNQ
jgi:hypothetical protein